MSDYAYDASAQELYLSAGTPRSRLNTLEGAVANKSNKVDLTNISITGSTNNTGSTITSGTFFYKDGDLVQAKTSIANGATLTLNTNYELVTAGGLNKLNASLTTFHSRTLLTTVGPIRNASYTATVDCLAHVSYGHINSSPLSCYSDINNLNNLYQCSLLSTGGSSATPSYDFSFTVLLKTGDIISVRDNSGIVGLIKVYV